MPEPLKNEMSEQVVASLATAFSELGGDVFNGEAFAETVIAELPTLELKERINLIADQIHASLELEYPDALGVVVAVAQSGVGEWASWPLCSFVERHGLDHPKESLAAMEHLTKAWSCEFAIRPYLDQHLELSRTHLRAWTQSPNEHVRRLPSEGTRPILPWGPKVAAITQDPDIGIELLDKLCRDDSETVRRSVANHLNDIAKADADLVVATLQRWATEGPPLDDKMVRHALRTLVKRGHPGALRLLGFTTDPKVSIEEFSCSPAALTLGTSIELRTTLTSTSATEQRLVIDFVVHHVGVRGTATPKVFKWKTITLGPGETIRLTKSRMIKNVSTRTYHAGEHQVDLQVAGQRLDSTSFTINV